MWPILGISALHLTYPKCTHTHIVNTHPEQWAEIYAAAPGEQLEIQCLAQGHLSYIQLVIHSPHLQSLPARDLWVTGPTLCPLGTGGK